MAEQVVNPTPAAPAPPAPDATPTPAPIPVPNTGSTQDSTMAAIAPLEAKANAAGANIEKAANTPDTPKDVPHARLLAMISGLATGLGAFGTSISTHGKEGGIQEVEQVQAQEQQQKINAQNARAAQKNQYIAQQTAVLDTNQKLAQQAFLMATLPDKIAAEHLAVTGAQQGQDITGADFAAAHGGMDAKAFSAAIASKAPISGQSGPAGDYFKNNAQQQLDAASKTLDPKDPYVQKVQELLANPNSTAGDLWSATSRLQNQVGLQDKATDAVIKKNTAADASPLGDDAAAEQNKRTEARYQVLNPGKPLPDEFKVTGATTPAQLKRITDGLKDTEAAQGIAAQRALTNAMHEETLSALRGPQGIDQTLQGPAYLDAVAAKDPGQADMIKAYGQGRLILSSAIARTPQGQALTKQILRAYPQYIAAKAEGYQKQYEEFTSRKTGTSINSYKTSLDHLNAAFDNVDKASDVDLNNPASKVHQQLDVDKEFLSTELAKAVSNGNLTQSEKDGMLKAIDGKILGVATKGKYQNQLREVVGLMKGKLDGFQSQWNATAVPGSEPPSNLQDAVAATQKLAGGVTSSGKAVSLKAAMALPANAGKTEDQVRADIAAHGHQVTQ